MQLKRLLKPAVALAVLPALVLGAGMVSAQQTLGPEGPFNVTQVPGSGHADFQHMDHVFIIMMENTSYAQLMTGTDTPYIQHLAKTYGLAESYYGVTHESQPNYIATLEGNTWNANQDDGAQAPYFNHTNLVDQLEAAHVSWKAYMQSIPSAGYTGPTVGAYDQDHNPFAVIPDIASSPARMANVVPFSQMKADLNGPHAPQFVWISPNLCNDMHGAWLVSCANPDLIGQGDKFLSQVVPEIMSSKAWTGNSAIFVVWDENNYTTTTGCCDSPYVPNPPVTVTPGATQLNINGGDLVGALQLGGGHVPMIVVARQGARGFADATVQFNHYSLLQTVEENWNLPFLANASDTLNVHSLAEFLRRNR